MPDRKPESKWSRADPERRAEAIAEYRRTYRAPARVVLPPLSRYQALDEDRQQQRALMELEARRIGKVKAKARYDEWERAERRWISATPRGLDET